MRRITCAAASLSTACLLTAMLLLAGCASIGEFVSRPPTEVEAQPPLPPEQQSHALGTRARAQEADGDAYGAAQTRGQLAPLLEGAQRARNAQKIQALLASLGAEPLRARYDALADDDPLKPFARAALEQLGVALPRVLPQLDHPVGTMLGEGNAAPREGFRMPMQVALLLPAHGALATPGAAVREGFFTAYFDAAHADSPRPQVRSYDSGSTPAQAQAAYQKAAADGASLVIGPLGRDAVAALFAQPTLPVPLLALNHPDNNAQPPAGSAEFGLLPEIEGAQAAAHLDERGIHQAVVFLVNDDRAKRAASAFKVQ
ncbi:MAG: penicillin-binding protein activator, partial [Pseudomonadota bacterium]|nr:penicillin-binding protein activator [Pseudomonadota bacterium]